MDCSSHKLNLVVGLYTTGMQKKGDPALSGELRAGSHLEETPFLATPGIRD